MKSTGRPDVNKLKNDPSYRQILELDFNDMIPFVLYNIRKKSFFSLIYAGINIAMLVFIALYIIWGIFGSQHTWSAVIKQSVAGIVAGSILVIPIHELLHGLAYRFLGAKKIRFGADMQQFIFFVTADRYPVSGKELYFLALTPFVMINAATIVLIAACFPQVILFPAFLLLSHNIMCIGDFAIVNYVHNHAHGRVFTFDETERKKSYFYEEVVDEKE
ncbi:MAG: DUF3267 domain-containing protein [Bacteroidales bacterium]|nr:DUF3267 domain-containing protein [Bacteroidales bacterium]